MKQEIIKLLRDTLQTRGKYDHRKITTFVSFQFAIIYSVLGLKFPIIEYVFEGFMILAGGSMAMSIVNKLGVFDKTKKVEDETR